MAYQSKTVIEDDNGKRISSDEAYSILKDYVWKQFISQAKDIVVLYNDDFALEYENNVDIEGFDGVTLAALTRLAGIAESE